jgi:magnesium chelatase family protein
MITVRSAVLSGIESRPVTIEIESTLDPGGIMITGLASPQAMRETRVRVRSSLAQCDIEAGNVYVKVTPEVEGHAGSLDLAIALGIAALQGRELPDATIVGELSLTGQIHPVRGAVAHARAAGQDRIIVPASNAADASATHAVVLFCKTLDDAINGLLFQSRNGVRECEPCGGLDFADIQSAIVRRALEISAAGKHPLLLVGAPGSGKTLVARRLCGILPRMTSAEALDVLTIHDAAGLRGAGRPADISRSFRAPHYTVSETGLMGGGDYPRPGEVTLAHNGVLFLDEIHEFRRPPLEALGRVLMEGKISIHRRASYVQFPAAAHLVGATNGCYCGYAHATKDKFVLRDCSCTPERLKSYRERAFAYESLFAMRVVMDESEKTTGETSSTVQGRVESARNLIATGISTIHATAQGIVDGRIGQHQRNLLAVARTIAALDGKDRISPAHVTEAITLTGAA